MDFKTEGQRLLQALSMPLLGFDANGQLSDMLNQYLDGGYEDLCDAGIGETAKAKKIPLAKAFSQGFWGLFGREEWEGSDLKFHRQQLRFDCLDAKGFRWNPYWLKVRPHLVGGTGLRLAYNGFRPFEGFLWDGIKSSGAPDYREENRIGFFSKPFRYLELLDGDRVWMSTTPYEMATMEESLLKARGNVLALGLGLGYWPFMASLKPDVDRVTVWEKDPRVIRLFAQSLLPFFPRPEKIQVVETDALEGLQNPFGFDFVFADLWHDGADGLPLYCRIKALEGIHPKAEFSYWIEESILCWLRRIVLALLADAAESGSEVNPQGFGNPETDRLAQAAYRILKEETVEAIAQGLSDSGLRSLAGRLWK